MPVRKISSTVVVSLILAATGWSAQSAQAASLAENVDCSTSGGVTAISAVTGDTLTLTQTGGTCTYLSVGKGSVASAAAVAITSSGTVTQTSPAPSAYWEWTSTAAITQVVVTITVSTGGQISLNSGNPNYVGKTFSISSGGSGGGSGSGSTSASQTPAPVLQQVGLPATGLCTDIDDADLAWNTGLSGGWAKAWGEWLSDGLGGWVCSRTMEYDTSQGAWTIAS